MHATHKRSLIKAISYRILGCTMTFATVYIFTNDLISALSVGMLDSFIKIIGYYIHERFWDGISWGRK